METVDGNGSAPSRVAAIVLAAGQSRRFGPDNKLLADAGGEPLVRRVVRRVLTSRARPVIVVTGHDADHVALALAGLDVRLAHNERYAHGMGTSVAAGIGELGASQVDGVVVVLADMPEVGGDLIDRLIEAFVADGVHRIVYPVDADGRQRNPVLWPRAFFANLKALDGDKGGRDLIRTHRDAALPIPAADSTEASRDIDTPEALAAWREGRPQDAPPPPREDEA